MQLAIDEKLEHLSTMFNEDIYKLIAEHLANCASIQKNILAGHLIIYIELLRDPLNNKNAAEIYLSLSYIRSHICKRNVFTGARTRFSYLLDLVHELINKGWHEESIPLLPPIMNASEHAYYRAEIIPDEALNKIKPSSTELFDYVLSASCSYEISQHIKKYFKKLKGSKHIYRHKNPLIVFLNLVSENNSKWYESASVIQDELEKYNDALNARTTIKGQTPRPEYVKLTNILSGLISSGLLPKYTILPIYKHKPHDKKDQKSSKRHTDALENNSKHLSSIFNVEIYAVITEYSYSLSKGVQRNLIYDLVTYVELLRDLLNNDGITKTSLILIHIRNHICQRLSFNTARQRFFHLLQLVKLFVNRYLLEEPNPFPKTIQSTTEYNDYKAKVIPSKVINKIALKLSSQELFDSALSSCCSTEIAKILIKHVNSFKSKSRGRHRAPLVVFLNQVSASHSEWYNHSSIIIDELKEYNENLNTRDKKSRLSPRSQYINIQKALSVLVEHGLLPKDTHLPNVKERLNKKSNGRPRECSLTASEIDDKLKHISTCLNKYVYESVVEHIKDRAIKPRQQKELVNDLVAYINLLREPLNNNETVEISLCLAYIQINICQRFCFFVAQIRFAEILLLVEHLIQKSMIHKSNSLPKGIQNVTEYELYKNKIISDQIIEKISIKPSALELFNSTLKSCCPIKIVNRLNEHVNSFKKRERKSHRKPIVVFLNQVSATHSKWYEHPKIIQGELLKYRGSLLDGLNRRTAYKNFQNLKNAISVLIEHDLLPKNTHLPDNLRKATNVDKVRKKNTLVAQIDLYDDTRKQSYVDTPTFIQDLKNELSVNLKLLVREAQIIVHEKFQIFLSKDSVVARSQRDEFLNHPELLVAKTNTARHSDDSSKLNPFGQLHPLEAENKVAYYDYYFDSLITNTRPHKISNLLFGQNILEYFGLTPLVSSAMQIIITEELGINPYSLYNAKVSSDGHEQEFVQVDDEGGVRIKTLKARARHVRTKSAKGSLVALSSIDTQDIDANICLKMALKMGARTRSSLGIESLWTCLIVGLKANVPSESVFQSYFTAIREQAYLESGREVLKSATLMKVRGSKGVLIYLESNGDTLKVAAYYGNQVKTALKNYIPKYLAELIYRVKIRSFQNILLFMAVASDDSPSSSLGVSEKTFKESVTQAFSNPDMGGRMFEQLTKPSSSEQTDSIKYFCVSETNIQIAIKYAKLGTDATLKVDCEAVLSKISEGPVIMKQMLRKAQLSIQDKI